MSHSDHEIETPSYRGRSNPGCPGCKDRPPLFNFTMAFQPIVDLLDNRISAFEALVRGPEGQGARFVLDQVNPENCYAFDQACRVRAIELASELGIDRQLSINFLPDAVYEPNACIRTTLQAANRTGFPKHALTFELLETQQPSDISHLSRIVEAYRHHGFKVALDDFGTGYSGLSRLADLQPDVVKLDRELIAGCDRHRLRLEIVASVVRLARAIGIQVVAEGAETYHEVLALRAVGIRYVQGFYFARPSIGRLASDFDIPWPTGVAPAAD